VGKAIKAVSIKIMKSISMKIKKAISVKTIKKYLKVYFLFAKNCLAAQMEYRTNFVFSILVELGWVFSHLLYLIVIYKTDVVVNGLTREAMYLFVGSYLFLPGIYMSMFFTNFANIPEYIRSGQLDIFITKPVSLQFMTTMRYVNFGYPVADFAIGIGLIACGWSEMKLDTGFYNLFGFILRLMLGTVWVYVLQIVPALLSFWIVKTNGIYNISYALYDMNKMPMGIYGKWIQRIGTYLLPLFPMANYPALFATGKLGFLQLLWGIVSPFIFLGIVRFVWSRAIKKYSSAGG